MFVWWQPISDFTNIMRRLWHTRHGPQLFHRLLCFVLLRANSRSCVCQVSALSYLWDASLLLLVVWWELDSRWVGHWLLEHKQQVYSFIPKEGKGMNWVRGLECSTIERKKSRKGLAILTVLILDRDAAVLYCQPTSVPSPPPAFLSL